MATKKRNYHSTAGYGSDGSGAPASYVEPSTTGNLISSLYDAAKAGGNGAVPRKHTSFNPVEQLSLFELTPPKKPPGMTPRESSNWETGHKDYGYGGMSDSSFGRLADIIKADTGLRDVGFVNARNAYLREYQHRNQGESPPGWVHIGVDGK